jgi:hypothetical protein
MGDAKMQLCKVDAFDSRWIMIDAFDSKFGIETFHQSKSFYFSRSETTNGNSYDVTSFTRGPIILRIQKLAYFV